MNHLQVKSCRCKTTPEHPQRKLWTFRMKQLDLMHRSCECAQKDGACANSKYVLYTVHYEERSHSQQALVRLLLVCLVGHIR